jgi:NAD(P)-dependent dehydrogenase (short-subunit alcohol dehydrogenase family)
MDELEGKVVVITGGASGIGFALATAFLAAGSRVVVADIEAPALDAARSRLGDGRSDRVHSVVTDVSNLDSVEALAAATLDRFGQVDILCNNAGVSTFNTVDQLTMADWHWVLGVDLWGVIHGVHTFLPIMLRQTTTAHIVNTASIAGLVSGVAYLGPYAVAKVGVVSLSETLRSELGASGAPIGVSVLCPSATNTNVMEGERNRPIHLGAEERTVDAEAWRAAIRAGFTGPAGKEPEEIAGMVVDAVRTNRFWVVSHDDLRPALEQRFAEILEATPYQSSPA